MRWLRKRKDLGLGTYVAPESVDPPLAERVASEGLAIAESAIRLAIRNRIIVDSLRDRQGFDTAPLLAWAAAEFETLADREAEAADRLRDRHDWPANESPWPEHADDIDAQRRELSWREDARRATAAAFRAAAGDDRRLITMVERARIEAWEDVAGVLIERVDAASYRPDPAYETERSTRMAELVALDLSALAIERGVPLS